MKKAVTGFFMSWGMFCAIPCPVRLWDEKARLLSVLFLPVIGLIIGAIWAAAGVCLGLLKAPVLFTAAVLTAAPGLVSGFIHLDGFMDCCDAVLSRRDLARRQEILKDSHTGAFAVICLVFLVLVSFSLFSVWEGKNLWPLVFVSASARAAGAIAVLAFKPIAHSSYAASEKKTGYVIAGIALAAVLALAPVFIFGLSGIASAAAFAGSFLTVLSGRAKLGGMSGDISGCGITVGECVGGAVLMLL